MNVASVIVDVPAMQTDRTFDYTIPKEWKGIIVPGMRVVVPFGPRKIQGFVIDLKEKGEVSKLKPIHEPMDLIPVLNQELLTLGDWLTEKTLCFKISAFQAMLPAAMKAKYEKFFHLEDNKRPDDLHQSFSRSFRAEGEVSWKAIEEMGLLPSSKRGEKRRY